MVSKKLAIPAAAVVLLGGALGQGRRTDAVHAQATRDANAGSVAITDYQFPVSTGMGGNTTASVADAEIEGALIDGPLGLDAAGKFFPDLASEVPSVSNGGIKSVGGNEVITVHLKPNQKWSDGQPIVANDYILPLLLDFAPEVNSTDPFSHIASITFSGNDMVLTYNGIYAPALSYGMPALPNATTPLPLHYFQAKYKGTVPSALLGSYDLKRVLAYYKSAAYKGSALQKLVNNWLADSYNSPADVFDGPYKIGEWTPQQRIALVPNPYYTALPADPKHPRLAKIQFVLVSTSAPGGCASDGRQPNLQPDRQGRGLHAQPMCRR